MGEAARAKIPSDSSQLDHLVTAYDGDAGLRDRLRLGDDWPRRWSSTWQVGADEVCRPVRDMAHVPVMSSRPMRGFTWRAKQRHRPGLEAMASAGGKHGFESLKEVSLLVALDFLRASEVLSQPFRLDFEHAGGHAWHIPDFLAVIGGGMWLLDVRPMELIKEEDALKFAAARVVAVACGWRYSVVAGRRPHVWSVLDHLSSPPAAGEGPSRHARAAAQRYQRAAGAGDDVLRPGGGDQRAFRWPGEHRPAALAPRARR